MPFMTQFYKNPAWIDPQLLRDIPPDEVSPLLLREITEGLRALQHGRPVVSVVIPVLNEETGILRTLHTLSQNKTSSSIEIVVVNNNSTDRTQAILDRIGVKSVFQPKPGWGPARQLGQEAASGKYILMADADCFYPPGWIQRMTSQLQQEGVTCVYGNYKFLASQERSRLKYALYELLRNIIAEVRDIRRPWLNARGMSMGYVRELGLKVGFVDRKIRGEDGRMCYELAQLGRIVRLRSSDVVVWTFPRTLERDGSLVHAIANRVLIELLRFRSYFRKEIAHDTHTSENSKLPTLKYFRRGKLMNDEGEPVE